MRTLGTMAALIGFMLIGVGLRFLYTDVCWLHPNRKKITVLGEYWDWECMDCGKRKTEKLI